MIQSFDYPGGSEDYFLLEMIERWICWSPLTNDYWLPSIFIKIPSFTIIRHYIPWLITLKPWFSITVTIITSHHENPSLTIDSHHSPIIHPSFSMTFPWFSMISHDFPWFSMTFPWFPHDFSIPIPPRSRTWATTLPARRVPPDPAATPQGRRCPRRARRCQRRY